MVKKKTSPTTKADSCDGCSGTGWDYTANPPSQCNSCNGTGLRGRHRK